MAQLLQWDQLAGGFLDIHSRVNTATGKALEAASFIYGLIELLGEKGLISIEELDARQAVVLQRLEQQVAQNGNAVQLLDPEQDKYTFTGAAEIDCPDRIPLCRAACCKLMFALSRQDVQEGIVRWNLSNPYLIAHGSDDYCEHIDRSNYSCTIREHRPVPCRAYDCRNEKQIWLDFQRRVINPDIYEKGWPYKRPPAQPQSNAANERMES